MGGCASSKYAVDEDKKEKKEKKPNNKKAKSKVNESAGSSAAVATTARDATLNKSEQTVPKVEKDELEFIDKEENEKQQQAAKAAAAASTLEDDDVKKETTTYQTTVVKHTQKEGEELMQHLKDEAFKTLQNLLKQQQQNETTTTTTTASSSANTTPETSTSSNADPSSTENIVEQIKSQVNKSLGNDKKELVNSIIDSGIELIRENKVKSMGDLQTALESKFPNTAENSNNPELIKKVVNATTGFLTAKGTEAGALLSSILANVSSGLQGVMNETEKTTVKVTRTVTEQLMSGGQINEITKVITRTEPTVTINPNINEILKDLTGSPTSPNLPTSPSKVTTNSGNLSSTITSIITEKLDSIPKDLLVTVEKKTVSPTAAAAAADDELKTKQQAEQVVSTIVSAAVEKVQDETSSAPAEEPAAVQLTNGHHKEEDSSKSPLTNGHGKHEEGAEVKVNGSETNGETTTTTTTTETSVAIEDAQTEFYKHGKKAAEEVVKKLIESEPAVAAAAESAESA